jgi:hypothetical protein
VANDKPGETIVAPDSKHDAWTDPGGAGFQTFNRLLVSSPRFAHVSAPLLEGFVGASQALPCKLDDSTFRFSIVAYIP